MVTADGQPVRWALNWLHGAQLEQRLTGSELMWRLCQRASTEGVPIYLYGSTPQTLAALSVNLRRAFPALQIVGAESPPYRALSAEEVTAMIQRVNASGAGLMFLGLGCPKQDLFAAEHTDQLKVVQLCVGAAFDFHAGTKPIAPSWMQRCGLEWLFRLLHEPRRLWKRYLVTNTKFVGKFCMALVALQWRRIAQPGSRPLVVDVTGVGETVGSPVTRAETRHGLAGQHTGAAMRPRAALAPVATDHEQLLAE